jgi:hypothetical protein
MIARRQLLLGGALAAALGAAWWASTLEQDTPEPVGRSQMPRASRSAAAPTAPAASLAALDAPRPPLPEMPGLFEPRSLQPPPPPPPPPPKPQAPTLPFRFVGAVEEGGERSVFLLEGTQVHMVRAGDLLGSQYRVERITASSVEFTYLPLKERQILATTRP